MPNYTTSTPYALDELEFCPRTLRVVTINGRPWFIASDVANILDFPSVNNLIGQLDLDQVIRVDMTKFGDLCDYRAITLEALVYVASIGQSKYQKQFARWVCQSVVPKYIAEYISMPIEAVA